MHFFQNEILQRFGPATHTAYRENNPPRYLHEPLDRPVSAQAHYGRQYSYVPVSFTDFTFEIFLFVAICAGNETRYWAKSLQWADHSFPSTTTTTALPKLEPNQTRKSRFTCQSQWFTNAHWSTTKGPRRHWSRGLGNDNDVGWVTDSDLWLVRNYS